MNKIIAEINGNLIIKYSMSIKNNEQNAIYYEFVTSNYC